MISANCGATCVAPDYVVVHKDVKDKLAQQLRRCVLEFYGENPQNSPDL